MKVDTADDNSHDRFLRTADDHDDGGQLNSVVVVCEVSAAVETASIAKAVGGAGLIGIEIHLG